MKNMISKNLITLRKKYNMTQEDVAARLNVSRQTVAKWESGETVPDIGNCNELARLYEVSLDDLVNFEGIQGIPIPPKGKYIFGTVTMRERGQIVIPKRARDIFNLKPGDSLVVLGDEERGLALAKEDVLLDFIHSIHQENERK